MRIPVGFRPTHREAMEAAREAAAMTGLRYGVVPSTVPAHIIPGYNYQSPAGDVTTDAFAFAPACTDFGHWLGLNGVIVNPADHEVMRV